MKSDKNKITEVNTFTGYDENNKPQFSKIDLECAHVCPYCGSKSYQINDHFSHIEFFHSDKPLI